MVLDGKAAATRIQAHETLGSTNTEALALARAGEAGPLWITAVRQTAGRGRRGRGWMSEPGNLHATLLLTDPSRPEHAAELSFVASLALRDAIVALAPPLGTRIALKWPNDVLLDGAKFAGILLEAERAPGRPLAVAIGLGVNCAHHPAATDTAATDLAAHGVAVTPAALVARLAEAFAARLAQWERGAGFAAIRTAWLAHAMGLGGEIRVQLPDRELTGRFETLDEGGRLMLRLASGETEAVTAGEVFSLARGAPAREAS
ncbi:MAG: biotin--[acetyl-CoA-carboxylase] ligase [Xanthobacteraceae bacterium]|nr:biotin--[acetyl-CoA-carboxylase] ligase [Xanthobacteraceae bacterium]